MKSNAKNELIKRLTSINLSKEKYSEKTLFLLYEKFKTETEQNILLLGNFQLSYLYLKDNEFKFLEIQKSYFNKNKIPLQSELFKDKSEDLKKSRN